MSMIFDRIPFIRRYRERKRATLALDLIAEAGSVFFVATLWLAAVLASAEMLVPGFAANYVPPGAMLAALAVTGGLSLAAPAPKRTLRQRAAYALAGAAASLAAFSAAWYYFGSVPDVRLWLSATAAVIVGGAFIILERSE